MQAYENPEVRKALYSFWDCLACTEPDFFSPFASYAVQAMLDGIKRMHSRVLFDVSLFTPLGIQRFQGSSGQSSGHSYSSHRRTSLS